MKTSLLKLSVFVPTILVAGFLCRAQDLSGKIDSLRLAYDFPEAVEACLDALEEAADSAAANDSTIINRLMVLCENGFNMMNYCETPKVVAREEFSTKDFFLFYPFNKSRVKLNPSPLDSLGGDKYSRFIYNTEDLGEIYFSACDSLGARSILHTVWQDSCWSGPRCVDSILVSEGNEIYPIVSDDGNTLYFSSTGFYGVGGYDLYRSVKDENGEWCAPQNLGFPFSSPYNDYLLFNTPDGKYTIFASDRSCFGKDSVFLYVLEYDPVPVSSRIKNVADVRKLCALQTEKIPGSFDNSSAIDDDTQGSSEVSKYMAKMEEVRTMRSELSALSKELQGLRLRFDEERTADLKTKIETKEAELSSRRTELEKTTADLQSIEMEFLTKGVVLNMDKVKSDTKKEVVGASSGYTFTKLSIK